MFVRRKCVNPMSRHLNIIGQKNQNKMINVRISVESKMAIELLQEGLLNGYGTSIILKKASFD